MLNINEFKSAVHKYDLERPNLFAVEFTIPSILKNSELGAAVSNKTENGKLITLFCKSVNLPGVNIQTADTIRYGIGPSIRMPVRGSLNDISMSFLNDSNSSVYSFFYAWVNTIYPQTNLTSIVPRVGSYTHPFKKEYQADMKIVVYHGKPGQFGGGGLLQTIASVASAAAGVPFLGSLLGGRAIEGKKLVPVKTYTVIDLYPTNIGDIGLSTNSSDSYSEFTVNFTYRTFKIEIVE